MSATSQEAAVEKQGLFTFYRELGVSGRRTFWACWGGYTLDAMDFMLFPLLIGTLIAALHIDAKTAGGIATVTLLSSALGGWLAGYLADRLGRVRTMQVTILLFSLGSLLSAFAQDATQLTIFRAILGFGFGGEAAIAAVTLAEVVAAKSRGRAIGAFQASYACGWGLAVAVQAATFALLPPETAWRVMFAVGAVPALLVFYVRRSVDEPAVSAAARSAQPAVAWWEVFTARNLGATVLGSLLTLGAQGGFYALMTWLPQFLRAERKISVLASTPYLLTLIAGCFFGVLAGGWLSDRLGRRATFMLCAVACSLAVFGYTHIPLDNSQMLVLGFPLGFFAVGFYAPLMTTLNELFPTRNRGAGVGFTYSFGRALGGLLPFLVGWASVTLGLGTAIACFAIASYGLIFIVAAIMKETRGLAFEA